MTPETWARDREQGLTRARFALKFSSDEERAEAIRWEDSAARSRARRRR